MKICPVGYELFRADGRTGLTKLIVAFHNFSNAPPKLNVRHLTQAICGELLALRNIQRSRLSKIVNIL